MGFKFAGLAAGLLVLAGCAEEYSDPIADTTFSSPPPAAPVIEPIQPSDPVAVTPLTEGGVDPALDRALGWRGRLDAVVNVAGISLPEEFSDFSREDWVPLVQTNLRGVFVVCQTTAPALARSGEGAIVNVSSILARVADPTLIAYGATKGGVSAMTRALAMKLAPEVRVNAVCPGDVATPGLETWIAGHPDPVGVRKQIEDSYPLRRICTPEDVAQAILFLAGPAARMITGQELVLDGGLTVKVY